MDAQSFSSNGMGQIMAISFKKVGGNNAPQATKNGGDSPDQPKRPKGEKLNED